MAQGNVIAVRIYGIVSIIAITGAMLYMAACSDTDGATKALQSAGYRNVMTMGYSGTGCREDEVIRTAFNALNQKGQRVAGVVCRTLTGTPRIRENR